MGKVRDRTRRGALIVEQRVLPLTEARADATSRRFDGVAAVFNAPAMIGAAPWGFRETIAAGAFTRTLVNNDQVLLADHDPSKPLARKSAATLRLAQTAKGLEVDADLPNTSYADDLIENLRVGNVKGMSIGFRATKDEWSTGADGIDERTLLEVELVEASTTAFPAYTDTSAGLRSMCADIRGRRAMPMAPMMTPMGGDPGEDDADPSDLCLSVEAVIDQAVGLIVGVDMTTLPPNVAQALALILAADVVLDELLDAMGLSDPDEDSQARTRDPAPATRTLSTPTPDPAGATRNVQQLAMRRKALAALYGLPAVTSA